MEVEPGIYQHYKGKRYEVLCVGRIEATLQPVVIYRALYHDEEFGGNAVWVRPVDVFTSTVEVNGKTLPRFKKIF